MIATILLVLAIWLALATITVVLVLLAVPGDDEPCADLDAELRDLIEQDRST